MLDINCHPSIADDVKVKILSVYPEVEASKGAYAAKVLTSIPPVEVDSLIITTPSGGFVSKITSANGYVSSFLKRSVASVKKPESEPITTSPLSRPVFHSSGSKYLFSVLLLFVIVKSERSAIDVVELSVKFPFAYLTSTVSVDLIFT